MISTTPTAPAAPVVQPGMQTRTITRLLAPVGLLALAATLTACGATPETKPVAERSPAPSAAAEVDEGAARQQELCGMLGNWQESPDQYQSVTLPYYTDAAVQSKCPELAGFVEGLRQQAVDDALARVETAADQVTRITAFCNEHPYQDVYRGDPLYDASLDADSNGVIVCGAPR